MLCLASSHVLPTMNVKKSSMYEFQNSTYEQNFVHKRGLVVKIASLT